MRKFQAFCSSINELTGVDNWAQLPAIVLTYTFGQGKFFLEISNPVNAQAESSDSI